MVKPMILMCATSAYGHTMPIRAIAREIISRGYNVTFVAGSDYKQVLEEIGATFVSLTGPSDMTEAKTAAFIAEWEKADASLKPTMGTRRAFIETIPSQFETVQRALRLITEKASGAPIVAVCEGSFKGIMPTILGAPSIPVAGYVGIGIVPFTLTSIDCAPPGPGEPPDSSPEGRVRNIRLTEEHHKKHQAVQTAFLETLERLGARRPDLWWYDTQYWLNDIFVQMCTPSFEYPRSDAPSTIRFAGAIPPGHRNAMTIKPTWWEDMTKSRKHIIFVAQGTLDTEATELITPTMNAFAGHRDFLVVAALGKPGLTLPEDTIVPENSRVEEFIPYDDILQHTEVFVTNGGYGSIQHGLSNGVPLMVAGEGKDKAENATRVEWSGVGINLHTRTPTPTMIYEAVVKIIETSIYKKRVKEMQAEIQTYDPVGVVIQAIEEVAKLRPRA